MKKSAKEVIVNYGSGSEKRHGIIIDKLPGLTKVKVTYKNKSGIEQVYDAWLQDKYIEKPKQDE